MSPNRNICYLLFLFVYTAHANPLGLKVGDPLVKARAEIIKRGWKPDLSHINDPHLGTDNVLIKHNIIEVEACTVDYAALCILNYKKQDKCLRVLIKGEQMQDMIVSHWDFICGG
jgi:hypothetical protein